MRDISLHKIKERKFRLSNGVDITLKKYRRVFQDDRLGRISEKTWVVEYTWLERKEHPNASEFTQKVGSFPVGTSEGESASSVSRSPVKWIQV